MYWLIKPKYIEFPIILQWLHIIKEDTMKMKNIKPDKKKKRFIRK